MREKDATGKFVLKSGTYRKTRSIRATDNTWKAFSDCADAAGCSTADLLEQWVASNNPCNTWDEPGLNTSLFTASQLEQIEEICKSILRQKKSSRVSMSKLLTALTGEDITL